MDIGFRSFVSQEELDEKRKIRQQEWEKTRTEDQPLEAPEEEHDPRTLFERLKEQRDKKQEEFEESRKLKHLIRGLDNDEVSFLEQVDENKLKEEEQKLKEEEEAIQEYQSRLTHLNQEEQNKKLEAFKKSLFSKNAITASTSSGATSGNKCSNRNKQANLLLNAVKVKKDADKDGNNDQNNDQNRSQKRKHSDQSDQDDNPNDNNDDGGDDKNDENKSEEEDLDSILQPATQVLGILPGMVSYYTDSSESEDVSSDENEKVDSSELDPYFNTLKGRQITKKVAKIKKLKKACRS